MCPVSDEMVTSGPNQIALHDQSTWAINAFKDYINTDNLRSNWDARYFVIELLFTLWRILDSKTLNSLKRKFALSKVK